MSVNPAHLTANGGEGSGSLYYRNLTDADAVFEPIVEMQDFSLELTRMHPDAVVGCWDAMWVHVLTGGSSVPSVDHLVPLVTVRGLSFAPDGSTLSWSPLSAETRYDVIRGNLAVLRDTGGDVAASVDACLLNGSVSTSVTDPIPATTEGHYYLVRPVYENGEHGTYDSAGAGQSLSRDPDLNGPAAPVHDAPTSDAREGPGCIGKLRDELLAR